eukprot:3495897-Pyramimonas_sp.AAC.1
MLLGGDLESGIDLSPGSGDQLPQVGPVCIEVEPCPKLGWEYLQCWVFATQAEERRSAPSWPCLGDARHVFPSGLGDG